MEHQQRIRDFYVQFDHNLHRYGKRPIGEIQKSIDAAISNLDREREAGKYKLSGTIDEIVKSPRGSERFLDRDILYLPKIGDLVLVGDIHGDMRSLLSILTQSHFIYNGSNKGSPRLLFLGDLINRGADPVGVADLAVTLKAYFPDHVDILMGNHEEMAITDRNNPKTTSEWLSGVLIRRYGKKEGLSLNNSFVEFFELLPTLAVTGNGLAAMHGGVPHQRIESLLDLEGNEELLRQLRWNYLGMGDNDPDSDVKAKYERRNRQREIDKDKATNFMDSIGALKGIFGHRLRMGGFGSHLDGRWVVVGSTGPCSLDSYIKSDFSIIPRWVSVPLALPVSRIDLTRTTLTRPSCNHSVHLHEANLRYYNDLLELNELNDGSWELEEKI